MTDPKAIYPECGTDQGVGRHSHLGTPLCEGCATVAKVGHLSELLGTLDRYGREARESKIPGKTYDVDLGSIPGVNELMQEHERQLSSTQDEGERQSIIKNTQGRLSELAEKTRPKVPKDVDLSIRDTVVRHQAHPKQPPSRQKLLESLMSSTEDPQERSLYESSLRARRSVPYGVDLTGAKAKARERLRTLISDEATTWDPEHKSQVTKDRQEAERVYNLTDWGVKQHTTPPEFKEFEQLRLVSGKCASLAPDIYLGAQDGDKSRSAHLDKVAQQTCNGCPLQSRCYRHAIVSEDNSRAAIPDMKIKQKVRKTVTNSLRMLTSATNPANLFRLFNPKEAGEVSKVNTVSEND